MPGNENLSPFMQRLARAHANCLEDLPFFGGLLLVSLVLDKTTFTDGLALWFLGARIIQSSIHLISTSESNGIYSHCLRAATSDVSPACEISACSIAWRWDTQSGRSRKSAGKS
jgi:hypothetical protein